jgi:signal peptidase I
MIILKTIFITLLFFLFVIVLIRKCFVIVTIEHESMSPALHDGDRVLVFRYWPVKLLKRGDIILVWPWMDLIKFNREPKPFGIIPYIKRVVGLPGDTIVTCLNELDDYHQEKLRLTYDVKGEKTIIVPNNHFFVRGDYPIGGIDSRTFGPVPFKGALGLVVIILSHHT